jgi:hypothetical protein
MSDARDQKQMTQEVLVEMASNNVALLDGTVGQVRQVIDAHEIVFGVWRDVNEPYGVGVLVIKGGQRLLKASACGESITASVTAIPCECREQAIATKQILGERDYDA